MNQDGTSAGPAEVLLNLAIGGHSDTFIADSSGIDDSRFPQGLEVDYLPGHLVPPQFPGTAAELAGYGAIILSDIGANSLLLAPQTFERSVAAPNRLT